MSFVALILRNVFARKVRAGLTAAAVAIGVATVVTLGVVTHSLRSTAAAILKTGDADFAVAQRGVTDVLNSVIDNRQVRQIDRQPGVTSAVGVLVSTFDLNKKHPLFLVLGVPPNRLTEFGVRVVAGRPFDPEVKTEIMLGRLAARDLNRRVGSRIRIDGIQYDIVGFFATGQAFGDAGAMLPLVTLQANERKAGLVTLSFVKVDPDASISAVRKGVEDASPQLVTVRYQSEFGEVDRNLTLISAADDASIIVALIIGAIVVMNTMLLSFFQRTREFGVLRAVGWSRRRITSLVMGEAAVMGVFGAAAGVAFSFVATRLLEELPALVGVLDVEYSADIFGRALATAAGMVLLGSLYPAIRVALLKPLEALRRE